MQRIKPDIDVVLDILEAVLEARPDSFFIQSLHRQYLERGGLSRRQLEGLQAKAIKVNSIPPAKMATLEAIIMRKPQKSKSELPENKPMFEKDEETGKMITAILEKYPEHKRVLFLKSRYDNHELLAPAEITELKKFMKLLQK